METCEATLNDGRCDARTNMFVMATIYARSGSAPVKVRNLSPTGAMVEGGVIPPAGSAVRLSRGTLSIVGQVVWRDDVRAGVKFDSTVSVADWLPRRLATDSQQRVDTVMQQIRAAPHSPLPSAEPGPGEISAQELAAVVRLLDSLAEDLAEDAEVLSRHASKLQALDLASQMLGKLGRAAGAISEYRPS